MPIFGYGCAVFMQSDIVNFQRQGWRAEEILAGLATVLPKNVFLYVASIPNLAALGTRFVLQGGTQNNMAVVKAEVDFINNSFRAAGKKPEIIVHEFCGESGAIGAAAESLRLWRNGQQTTFVGLDAVRKIKYRTTRNEETRCHFCKNDCLRTFIDIRTAPTDDMSFIPIKKVTKVPLMHGEQRLIIATCEKRGRSHSGGEILEQGGQRAHSAHGEAQETADRHSAGPEYLQLRAAVQCILRKPGRAAGEYHLLRLHQFRSVQGRSKPRRHRSVFSGEDRHFARLQLDSGETSEESAGRDLLPDVRRADLSAGEHSRSERLPDRDCHARNGEGRVHEGE